MLGEAVGDYRILGQLGAGGMAVVYEAVDERLGRRVALKFLPAHSCSDATSRDRFLREAQTASSLNHPGICTIYAFGEHQGRPYIVMERLEGRSLRDFGAQGRPNLSEILDIASGLLEALVAAHQAGVIHRDIKPENLFLTLDGRTKILDFGLARSAPGAETASGSDQTLLTMPGTVFGTVPYMSPEQLRGEPVDGRSDLYSLGLTLYELATGVLPTRAETPALSIAAILKDEPPPASRLRPELGPEFDRLMDQALAKSPVERFESAAAMLEAVQRLQLQLGSGLLNVSTRMSATSRLSSGPAVPSGGAERAFLPGESRLVGRDPQMHLLAERIRGAHAGRGGVLLLEGEPGLGKTRLLEWSLVRMVDSGGLALRGRCLQAEGSPPFLPMVEVLEQLIRTCPESALLDCLGATGPEVARLTPRLRRMLPDGLQPVKVPPEQERYVLFSSLTEFLERLSSRQPVLLAIEDLHWADEPTLRYLEYLAPRLKTMPLLVLATLRPVSVEPSAHALVSDLSYGRLVERVSLEPLPVAGVEELLAEYAGVPVPPEIARAVFTVTEGNPFFVEEVYRLLKAEERLVDSKGRWNTALDLSDLDIPEGVATLLRRRFARLRPATLSVLQRAALLGRRFRSEVLERLEGGEAGPDSVIDSLEEAERAGLVTVTADSGRIICSFSHALVRQGLLEGLSPWRQQRVHQRIAGVLASDSGTGDPEAVAEIAYHLNRAGALADPETCRRFYALAGRQAMERTAFLEAADLLEKAIPLTEEPGSQASLLFQLGLARTGLRDWPAAQSAWTKAVEIFESLGDAEGVGKIVAILAAQLIWGGRREESIAISRRGLAALGEVSSPYRCRLLAWAGHGISQGGDVESGLGLTAEALAMAEQLGSSHLRGHILAHRACQAFYAGSFREQADIAIQAVDLLNDNPWDLAEAMAIAAYGLFGAADLQRAEAMAEELARLAGRIGHLGSLWWRHRVIGGTAFIRKGDVEEFRRFAEQDLEMCRQAGLPWVSQPMTWLGLVEFWRGRREAAMNWFDQACLAEPKDFSWGHDTGQRMLCLAYGGNSDATTGTWRELLRNSGPRTLGRTSLLMAGVESSMVVGDREMCGSLYPQVAAVMEAGGLMHFGGTGLVATTAGIAAAAAGHWDAARAHLESAMALAESLPHRFGMAEACRWYGVLFSSRPREDRFDAAGRLAYAREVYSSLGLPEMVRRCELVEAGA